MGEWEGVDRVALSMGERHDYRTTALWVLQHHHVRRTPSPSAWTSGVVVTLSRDTPERNRPMAQSLVCP